MDDINEMNNQKSQLNRTLKDPELESFIKYGNISVLKHEPILTLKLNEEIASTEKNVIRIDNGNVCFAFTIIFAMQTFNVSQRFVIEFQYISIFFYNF